MRGGHFRSSKAVVAQRGGSQVMAKDFSSGLVYSQNSFLVGTHVLVDLYCSSPVFITNYIMRMTNGARTLAVISENICWTVK